MKRRNFYRYAGLSGFGLVAATRSEMAKDQEKQTPEIDENALISLLGMAVTQYRLRDILTQYGIPTDAVIEVGFSVEDQAPIGLVLGPDSPCLGLPPISKTFRAAIIDGFVGPMNTSFKLIKKMREFYGIPDPGEEGTKFKLSLKGEDLKMVFSGGCRPCPYWPAMWCYG